MAVAELAMAAMWEANKVSIFRANYKAPSEFFNVFLMNQRINYNKGLHFPTQFRAMEPKGRMENHWSVLAAI
jgi:hypothetical protein